LAPGGQDGRLSAVIARISIVGAGPGDPGLMTVRGRRRLEGADVVVYDVLVSWGVVLLARAVA
jgi:siroheme synthase